MLNSGEKKIVLCATKKLNILTLVLSEKKILNETKNYNPPHFKLNSRSLNLRLKFPPTFSDHLLCYSLLVTNTYLK